MRNLVLIVSILVSISSNAQVIKKFDFKVRKPILLDSISGEYAYRNLEYSYSKVYYSDKTFRLKGLFNRDTNINRRNTNLFKIHKSVWYIKKGNKWGVFFDNGKPVSASIRINGDDYDVLWKKTEVFDKLSQSHLYQLKLKPKKFYVSGLPAYFFTASDGVVAVDGHNVFLVRSDKKYIWDKSIGVENSIVKK